MKTAIQGIAGSFHHEAATKMLGPDIKLLPCNTFKQVFDAVKYGQAEQGVVAIENSIHGSITAVYRLLARNNVWVCGETSLQINQYLIAANDISVMAIRTVMSQSPAIAQCELWLESNLPNAHIEETHDTAESVKFVAQNSNEPLAAIASKQAAKIHKGTIIAGPINDDRHNYTRFFLLRNNSQYFSDANKTSIILETNHQPGALYNALGVFARSKINLSKLDSHPIATNKQHYSFYIDFDAGLNDQLDHEVLDVLRKQGCKVTILGTYKSTL